MVPVLLDTDIGSDIDDALALSLLLKEPCCRLLGITTVTGEPHHRASLASAISRAFGRGDIPVHVGAAEPWLIPQRQPHVPQFAALRKGASYATYHTRNTAVEFLQSTIRAHPHEITLIAIGPLTNIGLLFATDPEIPPLLNRLVLMGGCWFQSPGAPPTVEWNILCDPHAAARVFAAPGLRIEAAGLDVTTQVKLAGDTCTERLRGLGHHLELVADMTDIWCGGSRLEVTFHDPLAAALPFHNGLCTMETGSAVVELCGAFPGKTDLRADQAGTCSVARTVDAQRFLDLYWKALAA
ncbi:MAG: nucleoside hydrolase [Armatimonadetes bacterium]|nr:nucleoside hydrolase [Armatimonadota bacterium]MDE2205699.1 nucleoside hydrolase [Armatimonadota bacterium]